MQVIHRCCCGLDVHKKLIVACLISMNVAGERQKEIRSFTTMTKDILALAAWLTSAACSHVALESTGVYWKPVWNLLEGQFEVLLVNAQHIKAVPGRKTDIKDAEWVRPYSALCIAPEGVTGREIPCGQRTDRRWKRHKGTQHVRKASGLGVSRQAVMQDQRVAWPKLYCLKPSLLALSIGVGAYWLKRPQRRFTEANPFGICTL